VAEWEVPQAEVEGCVAALFERYNVWRMFADPPYWVTCVAKWAGEYGEERVALFPTDRHRKMAEATRAFVNAQADGSLTHDGDRDYARHIANAHRKDMRETDDQGRPLFVITKDRPGSPQKIDYAVAGILSWEARRTALAAGAEGMETATPEVWVA
jgi:hypothetical protein